MTDTIEVMTAKKIYLKDSGTPFTNCRFYVWGQFIAICCEATEQAFSWFPASEVEFIEGVGI